MGEGHCFDADVAAGHVDWSRISIALAQMVLQGACVCALHFSTKLHG